MSENTYRVGANRFFIAEQALAGKSKREAFSTLRIMVESETLVFKRNPTRREKSEGITHRIPLGTKQEQLAALKAEIGRVWAEMNLAKGKKFDDEEINAEDTSDDVSDEEIAEEDTNEEDSEEDSEEESGKPTAKGKARIKSELAFFLSEVRRIREFCIRREELAEAVDSISMRPAQAAGELIPAGIPARCLLHVMTLHWSADTRSDAGIEDFDIVALSQSIMKERGISKIKRANGKTENPHSLFGYILVLAECRIPIFLVGEYGIGKTHVVGQICDYLGLKMGAISMSLGATRGDLLGRFTASPERPFIASMYDEIYGSGGGFLFDEMDASDPGMLIVLNASLAGEEFYNSNSGETVTRHENFIPFAAGNTFGYGANRRYTAREHLDEATLDRWRMGRVPVTLDETIEEKLLYRKA